MALTLLEDGSVTQQEIGLQERVHVSSAKSQPPKKIMMKHQIKKTAKMVLAAGLGLSLLAIATPVRASGGSGSGGSGGSGGGGSTASVDQIKVTKCEYSVVQGGYVELLVHATSSNSSAHLYAYLPDGTFLGEVQNGGAGRYGGTVFGSFYVPDSILIVSSACGSIVAPCVPFQL
jgi:hypothetical protein